MKSDKKIFVAFLLNLSFSIIEFVGGIITGSIAILSDSVHDFGDSLSIGISYFLEKIRFIIRLIISGIIISLFLGLL